RVARRANTAASNVPIIAARNVICAKPSRGIAWPPTASETPAACATPAVAAVATDAARPAARPVFQTGRTAVRGSVMPASIVPTSIEGVVGRVIAVAVIGSSLRRARLGVGRSPQLRTGSGREDTPAEIFGRRGP